MSEYPHTADFPFTIVLLSDSTRKITDRHVRATCPKHAVEEALYEWTEPRAETRILGVYDGHIQRRDENDTQKFRLKANQVPQRTHDIMSAIAAGDDTIGLLEGFIDREEVTFIVTTQESEDGSAIIMAPLLMTIPESALREMRDMDGERLDRRKQDD